MKKSFLYLTFPSSFDLSDSCGDSPFVCPSPDFACAARVDFDLQFSVSCGGDFSIWVPSAIRFWLDLSVPPLGQGSSQLFSFTWSVP
jgi:hypothetical protein